MTAGTRRQHPDLTIAPAVRGAIRRHLLRWYAAVQRDLPWRRSADPYAIWISEVMLQQTQVKTMQPYYERFMHRFPDVTRLARAPRQQVLKAWQGLGYYSRARHLHRSARIVAFQLDGRLPADWQNLRALPGIGDYIAAAVLSIAFQRPHAVVDGNVKRVLARLLMIKAAVNGNGNLRVFQAVADQLLDAARPGDYNQAIMELGAMVCLARQPLCPQCPLSKWCAAHQSDRVGHYPVRIKKKGVPQKRTVACVIVKKGRLLMVRRVDQGLLGGLWEFAGGQVQSAESLSGACERNVRESVGLEVDVIRHLAAVRHTYTHFKLDMNVFLCRWRSGRVRRNGPAAHRWLPPGRIRQLPLHGAVLKALPALEKVLLEKQGPFGYT